MGVFLGDKANGGQADMGDHSAGVDAFGDGAEVQVFVGGELRSLDLGRAILVAGDSPAVGVGVAAAVGLALEKQGILGQNERAFDLRGLGGAETVEAAHRVLVMLLRGCQMESDLSVPVVVEPDLSVHRRGWDR